MTIYGYIAITKQITEVLNKGSTMGRFLSDLLDKVEKYVPDDTDTEVVVDKHGLRAKILLTHMFRTSSIKLTGESQIHTSQLIVHVWSQGLYHMY